MKAGQLQNARIRAGDFVVSIERFLNCNITQVPCFGGGLFVPVRVEAYGVVSTAEGQASCSSRTSCGFSYTLYNLDLVSGRAIAHTENGRAADGQ